MVDHVRGENLTLVPILRAGLGFLPGVQALLPAAPVSVIGLRRNEVTHQPEGYYQRLADRMDERTALLIDPMLATGGSAVAAIDALKAAGCPRVIALFLVAAPEGLRALEAVQGRRLGFHVSELGRGPFAQRAQAHGGLLGRRGGHREGEEVPSLELDAALPLLLLDQVVV